LRTGRNQGCSDAPDGCTFWAPAERNVAAPCAFHRKVNCAGKEVRMWKKPTIVEIAVGLEINSYACAELD
jgi:coenzyme PQQ precursor peptide PqqA